MSVLSLVAEDATYLPLLRHPKVAEAAQSIAGKFKVHRIEISSQMSLRDIVTQQLEMFLEPQRQTVSDLISTSYIDSFGETRTSLKLEPRYENACEVMTKLVELDTDPQSVRAGIQAAGIPSFGSLENLINAYNTLYRYLKDNYDDIGKLKRYWGYAR